MEVVMADPMVLVVEDDDELRDATCALLTAEGWRTCGASHGLEALAILRNGASIGALVLDLTMPVMDGQSLREALRQDATTAQIPVVVVTARPQDAKDLGVDLVLEKPYPAEALIAAVEECIPLTQRR